MNIEDCKEGLRVVVCDSMDSRNNMRGTIAYVDGYDDTVLIDFDNYIGRGHNGMGRSKYRDSRAMWHTPRSIEPVVGKLDEGINPALLRGGSWDSLAVPSVCGEGYPTRDEVETFLAEFYERVRESAQNGDVDYGLKRDAEVTQFLNRFGVG